MNRFVNKFVKVITIYGEEIYGVILDFCAYSGFFHIETIYNCILLIDFDDVDDIILIGEVVKKED